MNLCIVNEDHPRCNVPRKAIKACLGRGRLSLALSPSLTYGVAMLPFFSPQDFCSLCVFVYCRHNTGSCWSGSTSVPDSKTYRSLGVSLRPRLQEFSPLKLVFVQSPAMSQLPFKYSYQLLAAAVVSSPGKLSFIF